MVKCTYLVFWSLVFGAWSLVCWYVGNLVFWNLEFGIWSLELGILELGTWNLELGT
jgi:hypothetical protein